MAKVVTMAKEKPKKEQQYTSKVIKHEKLFYDSLEMGFLFSPACKRTGNNPEVLTKHFLSKAGAKEWKRVEEAAMTTGAEKVPREMRLWESHCKKADITPALFVEAYIIARNCYEVATMTGHHFLEYIRYVRENDTIILSQLSTYRISGDLFE